MLKLRHCSAFLMSLMCLSAQAQVTVLVGSSFPLTGPQAPNGKDNENGLNLALDELNSQNFKVAGQVVKFKLDSQDDQADPKVGVQVAQGLADRKVIAVIGPYNSGVAIPASRVYNGAGIPMLTSASNPSLTKQGFNNVFRIAASDSQLGGTMAEFAAKTLKARTAAIVDDRTAYGQGVAEEFAKVAQADGISIVDRQFTTSSATDFLGILTAIKAKNPDVIFFGGYAAQGGPMARQMVQRGLRAKLLGGDGICSADMGKTAGDAESIVYCSQGGVALEKTTKGREFIKQYKSKYHDDMQVYAVSFYDSMKLLADAMAKAGTTSDKSKIMDALTHEHYDGIAGEYSFSKDGELLGAPTSVYVIKGGVPVAYKK